MPSHHRAPTIKTKVTHHEPEIICPPLAREMQPFVAPDIMEEFIIYLAPYNLYAM